MVNGEGVPEISDKSWHRVGGWGEGMQIVTSPPNEIMHKFLFFDYFWSARLYLVKSACFGLEYL